MTTRTTTRRTTAAGAAWGRGALPALTTALTTALVAGLVAGGVLRTGGALPPAALDRLERTNHRGAPVSRLAGPAAALGAALGGGRSGALAALGAGAVGLFDDLAGERHAKGFAGHLGALRRGRVTSGLVKVVGIGAAGVLAARGEGSRGADALHDGAVVAAAANLLNLLDLRPGRALKAALLASLALRAPVPAGVALALLPGDLGERTMLGDAGANALGAALGVALLRRAPQRRARRRALAVLALLTASSEVVSFTRVIDAVPPLRAVDRLGRLPAP